MRRVLPIFIIYIIGLSAVSAYTWQGPVEDGTLYVNDLVLNITKTLSNTTIVIIIRDGQILEILRPNASVQVQNLTITLTLANNTTLLKIDGEEFFTIMTKPVKREEPTKEGHEYSFMWNGLLITNQTLYLSGNTTLTLLKGPLLEIITPEGEYYLDRGNATLGSLYIEVTPYLNSAEVLIASNTPLSATFEPIIITKVVNNTIVNETAIKELQGELEKKNKIITNLTAKIDQLKKENSVLKTENTKLKQRVSELEKQLKSQPNTAELQTKLVNLTKENRELKAELANLTTKYNQLKAKADFLEQQNEEYRQIIQQVMNEQSSEAKQSYIEKAKKERLVGSVLWKSLVGSVVVVGLVGYGLYRKKRAWELT